MAKEPKVVFIEAEPIVGEEKANYSVEFSIDAETLIVPTGQLFTLPKGKERFYPVIQKWLKNKKAADLEKRKILSGLKVSDVLAEK